MRRLPVAGRVGLGGVTRWGCVMVGTMQGAKCGLCLLLNSAREERAGLTLFLGLAVCREHLREVHDRADSPAARAIRRLVANAS